MKKAIIGAGLALVLAVVALFVIWLFVGTTLENLRDLVLVAVGLALFLLLLSLLGVALGLVAVVGLVRDRLPALLEGAMGTADRVTGTAGFISERVASPVIKASAAAAGARAAVQAFVRRDGGR